MADIERLTREIVQFRDDRDWKKFHNPKDSALSLTLEASEVLEHFQWKNGQELEKYAESAKKEISHELADVFYWVLLMSNDLGIDIAEALEEKLKINAIKYPINKVQGSATKYTDLDKKLD